MLKDDFNFFNQKITISNSMDVDLISGIARVDFFVTTKLSNQNFSDSVYLVYQSEVPNKAELETILNSLPECRDFNNINIDKFSQCVFLKENYGSKIF